ncbi:MAG: RNA pseudouridine synthase [Prevotella sp.]|nr:RNA pseudouridine synthase [Prevotella sp.]
MKRLHDLDIAVSLPKRFTFPFCYEPHPAVVKAAEEVQEYISSVNEWQEEINKGKMFGVLIVEDAEGRTGFLAAFSGLLADSNDHPYFVPAVYDILQPDGYFKTHEEEISNINQKVKALESSSERRNLIELLEKQKREAAEAIDAYKTEMAEAKKRRDWIRSSSLGVQECRSAGVQTLPSCRGGSAYPPENAIDNTIENTETNRADTPICPYSNSSTELIHESQFMKAELRRIKKRFAEEIEKTERQLTIINNEIASLKQQRKQMSDTLQRWIFNQFSMLNALGERRTLTEIFAETTIGIPPSGAGECCAPKLLQYAYEYGLKPLCMGEFWWGESPVGEIRRHRHFYPSCSSKCKPILGHMLKGLDVDDDPMLRNWNGELETIYEDEWLAVVNKPAGLLTTPGRNNMPSVWSIMNERWPDASGPIIVHRLDMATSGLLVVAKTKEVHQLLQQQFEQRTVKKRYCALLDGIPREKEGEICLPLIADLNDRPRQKVDFANGKEAHTLYKVVEARDGQALVHLYPITGRTHQLRVHCAHPNGLNIPITGDELYGTRAQRLYLHAAELALTHPVTKSIMAFKKEKGF